MNFNNQSGFSLIEVLVSMAIMSVGLLALGMMQAHFAGGNAQSRQIFRATEIAGSTIEQLANEDYTSVADGSNSITTYPLDYTSTWTVTNPATGIKNVVITVNWQQNEINHNVSFNWCKIDE